MVRRRIIVLPLVLVLAGGCGGKKNEDAASTPVARSEGSAAPAPSAEETPFGARIQSAGYRVVQVRPVPAMRPGWRGRAVVYRAGDGGGVLWTASGNAGAERVLWHWFFPHAAPDSIAPVELNDDGLWDARIHLGDEVREYVQGRDFSLYGGVTAAPLAIVDASARGAWRVLDGDTASMWSPGRRGSIDLAAPLGAEAGEMTVHVAPSEGPVRVRLEAGESSTETTIPAGEAIGRLRLEAVNASPDARVRVEVEGDVDVVVGEIDLP